ncbi:MAG: polyprenyl synthetase family protein [Candidatus Hydrogenedentota bacterium]
MREILAPIANELSLFERELKKKIESRFNFIEEQCKYVIFSNGKRIRPILTMLCGLCLHVNLDKLIKICCVIELIHNATIVHDDVLDRSDIRRGNKTLNFLHNSNIAVLTGDYLFSKTIDTSLQLNNQKFSEEIARVSSLIFEGEVEQSINSYRVIDKKKYIDIIKKKTGMLFGLSIASPLLFTDDCPRISYEKLFSAGVDIGTSFQIVDDVLDYTSCDTHLGKPVYKDLKSGKMTLPLIYTLKKLEGGLRNKVIKYFMRNTNIKTLKELVHNNHGVRMSLRTAKKLVRDAVCNLDVLPANRHRKSLEEFIFYLTDRKF